MHEKEKIFGLDLVRCVAIGCVLFAHTFFLLPFSTKMQGIILRCFGFIGVEIFFVLSGYLVGKILITLFNHNPVSFKTALYFWIRRWFRTLPNYYLALLLTTGIYYFSNKVFPFSESDNFLFFIFSQNLFTPHPEFFSIAWSLSVEEWFYLLLPVWFILWNRILKGKKSFIFPAIASFILIILSIRIIVSLINPPEWEAGIRQVVIYRLDALMIGVLAAYVHLHNAVLWKKYKRIFLISGILVSLLCSISFYENVGGFQKGSAFFLNTFFFNLVSISIALMFPYLSDWRIRSPNLFQKVIIHTSRISYSLYLLHLIVAYVVITIVNKFSPEWYIVKFIATWVCCFMAASLLYKNFELPLMNLRRKYKLKKKDAT